MTDVRVLLCTAPVEGAPAIARAILERKLAACVNILPGARSLYWWDGSIQDDAESLLVIKTTADAVDALIAALPDIHPYDTPELISLPVESGHAPYLAWVRAARGT
ncbi:MAG: divalent-cation tolerance protein CutA [Planctomycetota bacterium]